MSPRPLAGAVLLALLAGAAPRAARAENKADAFEGKIPPVSGALFRKAGRVELTVTGNLSLDDAFYRKYFGGLKLGYHLTEHWAVSGQVATGMSAQTGSAVVCPSNGGCTDAKDWQLFQVPGNIKMITGLELAWSPVYGKLNVFSERVAHLDLSLLAGADLISREAIVSASDAELLRAAGKRPDLVMTPGGHVGLGVRIFFAEWVAARLEVKDYVYQVSVPNWREGSGARKDVVNQLFTELGLSFFFPFHNRPMP
jgi:outer membrane beta-barrel protein